nr:hypothetical protein [Pandoravirus massiliensis]
MLRSGGFCCVCFFFRDQGSEYPYPSPKSERGNKKGLRQCAAWLFVGERKTVTIILPHSRPFPFASFFFGWTKAHCILCLLVFFPGSLCARAACCRSRSAIGSAIFGLARQTTEKKMDHGKRERAKVARLVVRQKHVCIFFFLEATLGVSTEKSLQTGYVAARKEALRGTGNA